MKDFCFPDEIKEYIGSKTYFVDKTGMSGSFVLIFDDMVLKIQKDSEFVRNEHIMMNWLKNKVPVPECICNITQNGINYLLMSRIAGKMSCEERFMNDPSFLVSVLALFFSLFSLFSVHPASQAA